MRSQSIRSSGVVMIAMPSEQFVLPASPWTTAPSDWAWDASAKLGEAIVELHLYSAIAHHDHVTAPVQIAMPGQQVVRPAHGCFQPFPDRGRQKKIGRQRTAQELQYLLLVL